MANIKNESCIIATDRPLYSEDIIKRGIELYLGETFKSANDVINGTIATSQPWSTVKVTTYEPSYTFDCRTGRLNTEAFKEDTKKEKENKMKKDELKPVNNTYPEFIEYDKYAGYSVLGIKVLAANKVVVVTIGEKVSRVVDSDGVRNVNTYKQICREPDVFDLKYAVALALTKYLHREPGKRLTTYGLERMTEYYLTYSYDFNKEVDRALKAYAKCEREEVLKKAKEEEIKRIKERRAAKQKRNRERRRERRLNGQS